MMKVFEAIQAKRLRQVAVPGRFATIDATHELLPSSPMDYPSHFRWRIGIELSCTFTGPDDGREHFVKVATRQIARELYGEIVEDLMQLRYTLMQEQYRGDGDPALGAIDSMMRKMQGME